MILLSYIDPGTTALIWQVLAGVVIGLGVVLGIWWRKIRTFFKGLWVKLFGKKSDDATPQEIDEELTDLDAEVEVETKDDQE